MVDGAWMRVIAWVTVACCWNGPAAAADQLRHRCATVADDAGRLACYDAEYGRPEPASAVVTEFEPLAPAAPPAARPATVAAAASTNSSTSPIRSAS